MNLKNFINGECKNTKKNGHLIDFFLYANLQVEI